MVAGEERTKGNLNHLGLSFYLRGRFPLSLSLSIEIIEPGDFREARLEAHGKRERGKGFASWFFLCIMMHVFFSWA